MRRDSAITPACIIYRCEATLWPRSAAVAALGRRVVSKCVCTRASFARVRTPRRRQMHVHTCRRVHLHPPRGVVLVTRTKNGDDRRDGDRCNDRWFCTMIPLWKYKGCLERKKKRLCRWFWNMYVEGWFIFGCNHSRAFGRLLIFLDVVHDLRFYELLESLSRPLRGKTTLENWGDSMNELLSLLTTEY